MNRVGRKGYKIHIQVVGMLWDFRSIHIYSGVVTAYCSCSTTNPAEYIPTWPSLSWVSELINKKDSSCVKLVRSKLSQFSAIIVSSAIMCENLTVYFRVCLDAAREHSWILRKQGGLKLEKIN